MLSTSYQPGAGDLSLDNINKSLPLQFLGSHTSQRKFWFRFVGSSSEIGLQGIGGAAYLAALPLDDDYPFFVILHQHGSVLVGPDLDLLFDACPEIGEYTA